MNLNSRIFLVLVFLCGISSVVDAQTWTQETEANVRSVGERMIVPNNFVLARVNDDDLKQVLSLAPMEDERRSGGGVTLSVMLTSGEVDEFEVVEYAMMEPGLAAKFPEFKTYIGLSRSNPYRTIRIDHTLNGFRAVIADENGRTYIDPYQKGDSNTRIIYKKEDLDFDQEWRCEVESTSKIKEEITGKRFAGDCQLREYRIAVAATGEFTVFHGGAIADGLAAIVTTMNRVNQIFEQDLAVRMVLIANNNLIVYDDGTTDPYTNGSPGTLINENQVNVDNVIGSANYDIGHVFSTAENAGVATLRSLCYENPNNANDVRKARGVTGLIQPTGDPFSIDYVAHEIGHQFGGNHTQNNSCQRNPGTAVEPGSASTIMGYAGICAPNVQNNSDAYFHAISIAEMTAHITGDANACAVISNTNTSAPVLSALQDYTVPHSTSLVLEVEAMDADAGDALTYCWEQIDNQVAAMPPQPTNTGGPAFRSLYPSASNKRYLPNINAVIADDTPEWEVLPSVSRTMNWRVTVRDHLVSVGCTDETDMEITVDGSSGPFRVDENSVPAQIFEGQSLTLQWDVGGTDIAPVSCANVDIFLSTDGGLTYPTTLLAATANDGSEEITIPNGLSTTARIMVKCSDNIFFDINDMDFEIEESEEGFVIDVDPLEGESCNDGSIQFTVNSTSVMGFSDPITLNATGQPAGSNVSFSVNPIAPGASSIVTVSNFGNNTGNFPIEIVGTSGSIVRNRSYSLTLASIVGVPTLLSPSNGAVVNPTVSLSWGAVSGTTSYEYEVSSTSGGGGDVSTGIVTENFVNISGLQASENYFWRIRSQNICGISAWSPERVFSTTACATFFANDLPKPILDFQGNGPGVIQSSITVSGVNGLITDVDIINVQGTHSYIQDLVIATFYPGMPTEQINMIARICGNDDDFNFSFDDDVASLAPPCPPTDGGAHQPEDALAIYNGRDPNGVWNLVVGDFAPGDTGFLNSWGMRICTDDEIICDLTVDSDSQTGAGTLLDAIECASAGDIITLESSLANQSINLGNMQMIIDKNLTIQANPADNITISYTGTGNAMEVKANATATLQGITFMQN